MFIVVAYVLFESFLKMVKLKLPVWPWEDELGMK